MGPSVSPWYEVDAWYYSPFPGTEQSVCPKLFVCEFCLKVGGLQADSIEPRVESLPGFRA
jgi:hypothetical protein